MDHLRYMVTFSGKSYFGIVNDLSLGGGRLSSNLMSSDKKMIGEHAVLTVITKIGTSSMSHQCKIIRQDERGLGVKFADMPGNKSRLLQSIINHSSVTH
ncbi:MAG: PilZ domain-containing protein [Methylococcales bacterium]|jgi:hypothetical protein|nr:PilZ domain-containing protein [Methylococcales bacterium]MBT7408925.1 PilZ domain-containing protein [Methylococcales bacterium]